MQHSVKLHEEEMLQSWPLAYLIQTYMFIYYILFTDCGERHICFVFVNGHCNKKVAMYIYIMLTLFAALLIAC